MYPVVLGSPPAGSLPVRNDWQGLSIVWEGPDGTTWNLTDPEGGVVLTRAGLEGLDNPRITKHSSIARAIPGKRTRGWRAESRDVFWPVYLWADGSKAWLDRQRAFRSSIHPTEPGTWRVTAGDEERTLRLTGVFDDPHRYERDPMLKGWALYGITLEADQPFWAGERVRRGPWGSPDPRPFIPAGGAPSFTISSSTAFGSASIPNPGDVEGWGVWWVVGPLTDIELGVGDSLIRPFNVAAGVTLRIDTDPRNPSAEVGPTILDEDGDLDTDAFVGTDATEALGLQDYAPVPPGQSVPLHVEAVGAGQILFDLVPLSFRAF